MDKQKVLDYHLGGKIGTSIIKKCESKDDLSIAYTPGVAIPCLEIKENPEAVYDYTNKRNSVAVITNGTAVLGLGDIGVLAGKPVMEGKAMLFKKFGGVDAVDVLVDSHQTEKIIETVKLISKTYGGINLEDIKAPECFEVENRLKEILDIPVFHDDQHGTAIVVGAGLMNALKIAGKKIEDVKIVFSGAGAAGIACANFFLTLGAKKENIILCDSKGVVNYKREVNESKKKFATERNLETLEEAIRNTDVFVGVSKGGILNSEMIKSLNENPIIFALANPEPEIRPEIAKQIRNDIIIATGRSDYPNQINNILAFPFIFRGALDVRARKINEEMKIAASIALVKIARENDNFGREYIIPNIWDEKLFVEISFAVAKAAIESGVARKEIDLEEYKKELERYKQIL